MKTASNYLPDFGQVIPISEGTSLWENHGGEWVCFPSEQDDPYTLLASRRIIGGELGNTPQAFALLTSGWASPLNDDGTTDCAPSEHPQRRRVHLMAVVCPDGSQASRIVFEGEEEPTDDTSGEASGALADALDACAVRVWGSEFTSSLVMQYATGKADSTASPAVLARLISRVENVAPLVAEALEEGEGE